MIKAFNLASNRELRFSPTVRPEWAVAYAYAEDNNLMSALFAAQQDDEFEKFIKTLPMTYGTVSVACGDWVCLKRSSQ